MKIKAANEFYKFIALKVWPLCAAMSLLFSCPRSLSAAPIQYLKGHVPAAVANSPAIGRLPGTNYLRLAIGLPLRNPTELTNLLAQIYNPASTNYHHFLTSAQFTERFGPTTADYEALRSFARANGLEVTGTHANRALLDVAAQASQIEQAFHIHLRLYPHPREARNFFAPDAEPSLNLAVPVLHISGLDNFIVPHPMNLIKKPPTSQPLSRSWAGSGTNGSYLGKDFRTAYVPGTVMTGLGQQVGLYQYESGFYQSDITTYENQAGLPNVPVTPVLLDNYTGGPGFGNDECSLDIEMAISMAPGLSQVLVYEGSVPDDILTQMATDDQAKQLSSSYAFAVDPSTEQTFQQFAAQGQSFFNASGDDNAWVGGVMSPSDDPNITIVGGTTLTTSTNGVWLSEKVWRWNDTNGSGGGISTQYPIPSWQQGVDMTQNQGSTAMRNIPDVALTADNVYVTFGDGTNGIFGGTSCASPLWAGFTALMNQQAVNNSVPTVGFVNPTIYTLGEQANYTNLFHDVVTGNNTNDLSDDLFFAVLGYDLCTGWGTPAGQSLIDAMVGPANPTPVYIINQPTNMTVTVGATATFNVLVGGLPPFSYQWSFNGTNLVGATNDLLILDDVQTNQAGNYEVVVTNEFGSVTSSVAVLTVNQPGACDPAPSGLIGWWPGEGNANDIIGTNNGVLEGAISFAPGEVGQGFLFTDPSDDVRIPASASLDVGDSTGSFTVEAWINCSTASQLNPIFEWNKGDGTTLYGVHFYAWSDGTLYCNLVDTSGIGQVMHPSAAVITAGTFYHVALTYDHGSGYATIYCDGNVVSQANVGQFTPQTSYDLYLGHRPLTQGETYTFSGVLDEPSLYNRALTGAEIAAIYNAGSGGKCPPGTPPDIITEPTNETVQASSTATFSVVATGSAPLEYQWMFNGTNVILGATNAVLILANVQLNEAGLYSVVVTNEFGSVASSAAALTVYQGPPCDPEPSGLVGWWPGDGDGNDIIGTNNGVLEGAISFAPGEVGLGFLFSDPSDFVLIPASASLDVGDSTGSFTVEAWINCSTVSQLNPIFEWNKGDGVTIYGTHFYVWSDGSLYANVINTSSIGQLIQTAPGLVTAGTFYHVALTYDNGSGLSTIYCNGNQVAQVNMGQFTPLTSYNFYLGHRPLTQGETYTFSGVLDEPSLYNRALSSDEIAAIYNIGVGGKCPPAATSLPPVIIMEPTNETVQVFSTAIFNVQATGSAPLGFQWLLNKTNFIVGATNSNLILTNVQVSEAGLYSVIVTNDFGFVDSSNALLMVLATPPTILSQPTNETVLVGGTASFGVTATGTQPLSYQWSFNGTNLAAATNASIILANVQLNQSGKYSVQITNLFGSVLSSNASLTVNGLSPTISSQPANQSVPVGSGASFSVAAGGTLPLAFQWKFQGTNLPGATNTLIVLTNVQLIQSGNYAVQVTNAFGAILSSNGLLTVYGLAPIISSQPASQSVDAGSNAQFSITASGTIPLAYQWKFQGTNLPGATNSLLIITNLQAGQAGIYAVLVTNAFGSLLSSNAVLEVNFNAECTPAPSGLVSWWPGNGNALDLIGTNNGVLEDGIGFANGEVGQGFYYNNAGEDVRIPASATLNVGTNNTGFTLEAWISCATTNQANPIFEWNQGNGTTSPGVQFYVFPDGSLYCNVVGANGSANTLQTALGLVSPNLFYHVALTYNVTNSLITMYLNGVSVDQKTIGQIVPQTSYSLYLGRRPPTGSATYTFSGIVDAPSIYGRPLAQYEIQGIYNTGKGGKCVPPPAIVAQPGSLNLAAGSTAAFAVSAFGANVLGYQWYWNTNYPLAGATNATLTVTNVQTTNAGTYSVLITNLAGSALSSNALLVVHLQDHFTWTVIPSPRFVSVPFTATIQAQNITNGVVTNFTGTVNLTSTLGVRIQPPVSGPFVRGSWTGPVSVGQAANNLVLQANDGLGDLGLANPINIVPEPYLYSLSDGYSLLMFWPTNIPGFVIQTSPKLNSTNWIPMRAETYSFGNSNVLFIPLAGTNAFFRLWYTNP